MKDIVVIANFCRDLSENDNGRFVYLCNELAKYHHVELITSSFSHIKKERRNISEIPWPFKVTFLEETGYKKNVSVQRFFSHYVWGQSVKKYLKSRKKPDIIYCAVPSLTGPFCAAKYCEKNDIKFVIDVQDLWPLAFKMVFNIPVLSDIIFAPFDWLVNGVYSRADEVVAVSDEYVKRALAVNKKCRQGLTVYLGTKSETYDIGALGTPVYKKKDDKIFVAYCGSLAASYDVPNLMRGIKILNDKGAKGIELIVMGDGANQEKLEALAKELNIDAVFTGRLPYDEMCAQLSECDIAVNPIRKGSAGSVINKVGDYAMAGIPVINTQECQEYRDLLDEYNAGINCECENPYEIAQALEKLISSESLRAQMGRNSRKLGEERFDRKHTYQKIVDLIYKLSGEIDA